MKPKPRQAIFYVARLIETPEGWVSRPAGIAPLDDSRKFHEVLGLLGNNRHVGTLVVVPPDTPTCNGYRAALRQARKQVAATVAKLNEEIIPRIPPPA